MTDRDVVLTVDRQKLFDAVKQFGTDSIGQRLVQVCLDDSENFRLDVGMAMYGITARRIREEEH